MGIFEKYQAGKRGRFYANFLGRCNKIVLMAGLTKGEAEARAKEIAEEEGLKFDRIHAVSDNAKIVDMEV